jgi:hypothetical protein
MSNFEKIKIYEDFPQLDFVIWILCVIDVLRLKMNIVDVNLIIQWKESFSLRTFMQRIDRATKDSDRVEEFIWFHSIWCKKAKLTRFNLVVKSSQFEMSQTRMNWRTNSTRKRRWTMKKELKSKKSKK